MALYTTHIPTDKTAKVIIVRETSNITVGYGSLIE